MGMPALAAIVRRTMRTATMSTQRARPAALVALRQVMTTAAEVLRPRGCAWSAACIMTAPAT